MTADTRVPATHAAIQARKADRDNPETPPTEVKAIDRAISALSIRLADLTDHARARRVRRP